MNFLKSKQNLETYSVEDIDVLARYNGIKVLNRDDRLWLLSIAILSNRHYAQMITILKHKEKVIKFDTYFTKIKQLGSGASGFVLLAQVKKAFNKLVKDQYVAIKLIRHSLINQRVIDDTQREIAILQDLSKDGCNPHIVCYYDSFTIKYSEADEESIVKKYFAIVMEYIPGDNLQRVLEGHLRNFTLIPNDTVLQYMNILAQTLDYLHDRNIVHRDIKTSNIVIDKDVIKYIDFGFSCFTLPNRYSCLYSAVGSPSNMSPELWHISMGRLKNFSTEKLYELFKKSDVWALGIVFYEILYGNLPQELLHAQTLIDVREVVQYHTISVPYEPDRDPRLIEIVRKMLINDADSRSSIKMVIDELHKLQPIENKPTFLPKSIGGSTSFGRHSL
jgi:serine/threonine protein kinase